MLRQIKFLLVDDQPVIRSIVSAILKSAGAQTIEYACDGSSALEAMRTQQFDIVITDMMMAGVDGLDLVRLVRGASDSPNVYQPIIMLTARTEAAFVHAARDAGVTESACKPISAANLLSRVNAVIMRPRPFVRAGEFFGPCRRRRSDERLQSLKRRKADQA